MLWRTWQETQSDQIRTAWMWLVQNRNAVRAISVSVLNNIMAGIDFLFFILLELRQVLKTNLKWWETICFKFRGSYKVATSYRSFINNGQHVSNLIVPSYYWIHEPYYYMYIWTQNRMKGWDGMGIVLFHKYYYLVFIEQQSSAASVEKMNGQMEFLFVLNNYATQFTSIPYDVIMNSRISLLHVYLNTESNERLGWNGYCFLS